MNIFKTQYQKPISKHSQNFNERNGRVGLNADECIAWAKENCINLEPFQIDILRAFCDGREVRAARGIGRTTVAKIFGAYIAALFEENNMDKSPELLIPWEAGIKSRIVPSEWAKECRVMGLPEYE